MRTFCGSIFAGLALAAAGVQAGDWLQFRGPGGRGISAETNLPTQLNPSQHLAWKVNLPGRGLSSPIVVGDRVLVTCASGPQQNRLHVLCFSARDGKKLWERQFWATGRTMTQEKTCVAAPTAVSDGRLVYAIFSSNDLVCLDLEGRLIWLRGLTVDYPNASNSLGLASSLVLSGQILVAQVENDSDSCALGMDAKTGLNVWRMARPKSANWCSPVEFKDPATGQALILLQSSKGLHAVDPLTGRVAWAFQQGAATIPSLTVEQGMIYLPAKGITALQASAAELQTEPVWRSAQLQPGTSSPVVVGGRIYIVNSAGILTCGDAQTGARLWQLRLAGPFSATPVAAGKCLYLVNEKGLLQVVDVDAALTEGQVVGKLDLAATILCTPALAHGAIYLRSDATLWKLAE